MRKLLVLSMCSVGFAGGAQAQSSVTMYGLLDAGVTRVNNVRGSSMQFLDTGNIQGNRLGFRGREDLGSGLSAVFTLENGFNLDDGTQGQGALFGRQAFVGLSSTTLGTVTLGRQYDTIFDSLIRYAHGANNGGSQAWHLGGFDRLQGARFNNSVKYQTIKYSGFSAGAVYSFGENPDSSTNRAWGLGTNYEQGALSAGLAYNSINNVSISPSSAGIGQFLGTATTVGGVARSFAIDNQIVVGGGAKYVFDRFALRGLFTSSRFSQGSASNTLRAYEVGIDYKLTSPLTLTGGYTRQHLSDNRWNTYLLSLDYALSKRTDVYVLTNSMKASGGNVVAALAGLNPSSDRDQRTYRIGVRHRF